MRTRCAAGPSTVQAGEESTRGLARGIDLSGALLVETPHGLKKFFSGEVTVRPRNDEPPRCWSTSATRA